MNDLERAPRLIAERGLGLGAPLVIAPETESTNDDAKRGGKSGAPHGAVWIAEAQSRGRGRQGRAWSSPPGENLLFSVLLRVSCAPQRVPPLALVAGLAVRDAVARAVGDEDAVLVKWPNDVLVRGKKIAGVLVESAVAGSRVEQIVVGIGVNVHTRAFPPELADIATSVALEGASAPDRATILADVLASLERDVELVAHKGLSGAGHVHARLAERDALRGRAVEVDGAGVSGEACGIDADGRLLVRREDGIVVHVASGEIKIRVKA